MEEKQLTLAQTKRYGGHGLLVVWTELCFRFDEKVALFLQRGQASGDLADLGEDEQRRKVDLVLEVLVQSPEQLLLLLREACGRVVARGGILKPRGGLSDERFQKVVVDVVVSPSGDGTGCKFHPELHSSCINGLSVCLADAECACASSARGIQVSVSTELEITTGGKK